MFHKFRLIFLLLITAQLPVWAQTTFQEQTLDQAPPELPLAVKSSDTPSAYVTWDISQWSVYDLVENSRQAYSHGDYKDAIQYRYWAIKNGDDGYYDLANYYVLDGQIEETLYWLKVDALQGSGTSVSWLEQDEDFAALIAHEAWPEFKAFLQASEQYWTTSGLSAYQLVLPTGYQSQVIPILVALHGKGDTPRDFIGEHYQSLADELNIGILAISGHTPMGRTAYRWSLTADEI